MVSEGRATIQLYTTPRLPGQSDDPGSALVAALQRAKTTVTFGAYSLTLPAVAGALIAAAKRGVSVVGLGDASEWATSPFTAEMLAAGVQLRFWGSKWRLMHLKVAVVDAEVCAWGSFNWTVEAETENVEDLTIATDAKLAGDLSALISEAWSTATVPVLPPAT